MEMPRGAPGACGCVKTGTGIIGGLGGRRVYGALAAASWVIILVVVCWSRGIRGSGRCAKAVAGIVRCCSLLEEPRTGLAVGCRQGTVRDDNGR
jgi:hypothetical protein